MKTFASLTAISLIAWASWPSVYQKRLPQVVQILVRTTADGHGQSGSGTLIGTHGTVLTAAHVVDALEEVSVNDEHLTVKLKPRYKVVMYDKTRYACTVTKFDKFRDLALMHCDGLVGVHGVPGISRVDLVEGAAIAIIGQPNGFRNSITQGIVFQRQPEKGKNLFDITSGHGASGGPIFNAKGELVGVVQFGFEGMFEAFGNILGGSNQVQLHKFLDGVKI